MEGEDNRSEKHDEPRRDIEDNDAKGILKQNKTREKGGRMMSWSRRAKGEGERRQWANLAIVAQGEDVNDGGGANGKADLVAKGHGAGVDALPPHACELLVIVHHVGVDGGRQHKAGGPWEGEKKHANQRHHPWVGEEADNGDDHDEHGHEEAAVNL